MYIITAIACKVKIFHNLLFVDIWLKHLDLVIYA